MKEQNVAKLEEFNIVITDVEVTKPTEEEMDSNYAALKLFAASLLI